MATSEHNMELTEQSSNIITRIWQWVKNHPTQITALIFWTIVILGTRQYMQANNLGFAELAMQLSDLLTGTWYGPLLYIVIYLLRPLILFPASLLTLLAGSIFGLAFGYVYALIAGTISALIPYSVGRWFSSEEEAKEEALGDGDDEESRLQKFIGAMRENPFQAVLTMRLLFLPYDGVSLLAGGLRIGLIPFMAATMIGNLGGTFAYVGAGASIEGDLTTGEVSVDPTIIALTVGILIVSIVVSRVLNRRQEQQKNEKMQAAEAV
ncbi:MAG: VTT domain-containing protein [Chloroflexota bacterium]